MSGRKSSGQRPSSLDYLFGKSDDNQSKVSSPSAPNYSGGGQSSLGYLFGANELGQASNQESKQPSYSPPVCVPPYGTDDKMEENSPEKTPTTPLKKDDDNPSYVYHKVDGKNQEFLMAGRPSTRVTSVPGGDSSIGYLFGDKGDK